MTVPLLINEPPLQILPALVKATGILEAIVLQETHYQQNGRPWVPNLGAQLRQRCHFWSSQDIDGIILLLENTGLLLVKGGLPKSHSIDYDLLNRMAETPLKVAHPYSANSNKGFSFDIELLPINYVMNAENKGYCLDCELTLAIKDHDQQGQVICHFPKINNKNILKLCEGEHIICDIAW